MEPQLRIGRPGAAQGICAAAAVLTLWATSAFGGDPEELPFRVDPRQLDFQQVWRGQTPDRRIRLVNLSDRHIEIRRLKSECECLSISIDGPTEMQPGGVLELVVWYQTLRQPAGPTKRKLTVVYEDDGRKSFDVEVSIDIRPGIIFEPAFLSFGAIRRDETRTAQVMLHTPNRTDFAIGRVEVSDPGAIRTDFARQRHSLLGPRHQLAVTVGPLEEPGRFSGTLLLHTQHWSDTELEIPVFAEVVGPLALEPTTVYRGRATRGQVIEETLKIKGWTGDPGDLGVAAETETLERLSPELRPVEGAPDRVVLRLTVPQDLEGNTMSGQLVLHAGDEKEPLARLNVFLYLPPTGSNR